MMLDNDPRTISHLITARQDTVRDGMAAGRRPSAVRVALGLALIRLGEKLRGCAMTSPAERLPSMPATPVRRAHTA